jgi:hypothetical protein
LFFGITEKQQHTTQKNKKMINMDGPTKIPKKKKTTTQKIKRGATRTHQDTEKQKTTTHNTETKTRSNTDPPRYQKTKK